MKKLLTDKSGFKKIKNKPSKSELKEYYDKKYFSQGKNYFTKYSNEELEYIKNKVNQKFILLNDQLGIKGKKILELGSGEGWILKKFNENGFDITGIDYSDIGCKNHNPDLLKLLILGDLEEEILKIKTKFDVIWIENVLEHVLDPRNLISNIKLKLKSGGLLAVTVPNDFSITQINLMIKGKVKKNEFWVAPPDHLSYFDKNSLIKFFEEFNFKLIDLISDYPIDLNLFCELTNYVDNKSIGKSIHKSRIEIENLFSSISDKKTNNLYRCFADMGIGRDLFAIFKKN